MLLRLVVAAILALVGPAWALEPVRPGQEDFIRCAVFAEGRLWTLADSGVLSEIDPKGGRREVVMPDPVLDMCVERDEMRLVTAPRGPGNAWTLRRRAADGWPVQATIERQADGFRGLTCVGATSLVLTDRRLIEIDGEHPRALPIDGELMRRPVTTTAASAPALYVGMSYGEWGGGLYRIDRRTGRAALLLKGNVNAIALEPWRPDCLAVAFGLVHFVVSGRIAEVCPERPSASAEPIPMRTLVQRAYGPEREGATVAFYALAPSGGRLVAAGLDGLTAISGDGIAELRPLPPRRAYDGVMASFELPHLVVVLTRIATRSSVSGAAPLLVPRP